MLCVAQRNRPEMINDIPSDRYEIVGYNGRFEFMSVNARTIDYARAVAEARGMGEAPIALSGQNPRAVAVSAHRQYLREKATDPLKVERQDRINASESAQARSELAEAQRRESI